MENELELSGMTSSSQQQQQQQQLKPSPMAVTTTMHSSSSVSSFEQDALFREQDDDGMPLDYDDDVHHHHHHGSSHKTTARQTLISLIKGYIGPGCLSLPWAVSQLGIGPGCLACCFLAAWSSYNCWSIVRLKRHLTQEQQQEHQNGTDSDHHLPTPLHAHSAGTVTYPDLSTWLYGPRFGNFTEAMICVQQLAICTVFLSFCGENLQAVLERVWELPLSHGAVVTMALPAVLALSCLPDLKALSPVMAAGTALLLLGLAFLGAVVFLEWGKHNDDNNSDGPHQSSWSRVPLALCAILYSFEGINLILPIESAMQRHEEFEPVFVKSMMVTALVFCSVSGLCVAAFGNITNGSITAYLLEDVQYDPANAAFIQSLVLAANAAVSLSVLVTYPLQLFPCLELLEPLLDSGPSTTERRGFASVASVDMEEEEEEEPANNGNDVPRLPQTDSFDETASVASSTLSTMSTFYSSSVMPRVKLVFLTYIVAVAVPNVQSLISLAGALAGSSTALLIPPLLQLGFMKQQQQQQQQGGDDSHHHGHHPPIRPPSLWPLHLTYLSFAGGLIFLCIGTGASLLDIVRDYAG